MIFRLFQNKAVQIVSNLFLVFMLVACTSEESKVSNEGIIEYDTKVVDEKHPLAGLAPNTATLKFKNDKFLMEMSTMGMFNTMFIADCKAKTLTQMVKFMDVKQASIETEKEILEENLHYKLIIEETKEIKVIAGYKCHKLIITMADNPAIKFDAYYTKEMQVDNVNALSPYVGIKGMLMQYRLKKMGLELQFTAKKVRNIEIPDETFTVPSHFKIVSKEEMQKFFSGLQ